MNGDCTKKSCSCYFYENFTRFNKRYKMAGFINPAAKSKPLLTIQP